MTTPYDPDPLYVAEPDSDEAHYAAAAAYFERLEYEKPGVSRAVLLWGFAALVVVLAIIAAALLIAAPRVGASNETAAYPEHAIPSSTVARSSVSAGMDVASRVIRRPTAAVVGAPSALTAVLPDTATEVVGTASWYCGGGSACTRGYPEGTLAAAAGPALRVGDWRGRIVKVCAGGRCVKVILADWCACPRRVIDLYRGAFARLASPSRGVLRVSITWGGTTLGLPPTDTR